MATEPDASRTSCSSCRAEVRKDQSYFTLSGDVVCARCHGVESAHAQVERGRAAQIEASGGGLVGLVERVQANQLAARSHSEVGAIAAARPAYLVPDAQCQACYAPMPKGEGTYATNGLLVCRVCSAKVSEQVRVGAVKSRKLAWLFAGIACALIFFMVLFLAAVGGLFR